MPILLAIVVAVGGVVIWRRNSIDVDTQRLSRAVRGKVKRTRSGRHDLLTELGRHLHLETIGDTSANHDAEITRILGELEQLDQDEAAKPSAHAPTETETDDLTADQPV